MITALRILSASVATACLAGAVSAQSAFTPQSKLSYSADLRARFESDYDSQRSDGTPRDDRNRGRIRFRLGLNYEANEHWKAGLRLRTGNHRSQQSPHLTFWSDSGSSDDLDFVLDQYYLAYNRDGLNFWAGRNSFPFWKQNELFWDDDVTPTGLAASFTREVAGGDLTVTAGGFYLPDGGQDLHQPMTGAQVKYTRRIGDLQATVAPGFFYFFGEDDPSRYLLTGNGMRNYAIGALNARLSTEVNGLPVSVGADFYKNFEDYSMGSADPFITPANRGDDFGYVLSAQIGSLASKGDWLLGYYYAHLETFAVNASYAQDDWMRWGNGPQTRSSDFEGHELRAAYVIRDDLNVIARWYSVDSMNTTEDGQRFRLDLNFKF